MSFESFENINNNGPRKANLAFMILFTVAAIACLAFLPFAGFAGLAFLPVPAALLLSLKRYRDAAICAMAGIIILFIFNYILALVIIAVIASVAFYYRSIRDKNRKPAYSVLVLAAIFSASVLIYLLLESAITKNNAFTQIVAIYDESVNSIFSGQFLDEMGSIMLMDRTQLETAAQQTRDILLFLPKLLPGILVVFFSLTGLLNYYFSYPFFKRYGVTVAKPASFIEWDLPWYYCWGAIAAIACIIVPRFDKSYDGIIDLAGYNLLIIFGVLYLVLGISVLWGLLERFKVRNPVRIFILIIIFLFFGFLIILPVLGLIDIWANFRKLNRSQ